MQDLAQHLAAMPTLGIGWTKQALDHAENASLEDQLELEARLQARATQTPDFREGVAAFLEKRPPEFTGKALPPYHPIEIAVDDDRRRWRLTVLLRYFLAYPHVYLSAAWILVAGLLSLVQGVVILAKGRPHGGMYAYSERALRYWVHVNAYILLVADPFPRFRGWPGTYPIDLEVPPPGPQSRWKTVFRLVLAIPALVLASVLSVVSLVIAVIGWFAALAVGRMPKGMRDLSAYCLRYQAQTYGYLLLLTDRYPSLASRAPQRPPSAGAPASGGPVRE